MTSVPKTQRVARIQLVAILFLTIAGVINYIDRSALSIANTTIREEMHITPTEMGWLLSAFSLAYAFSQLPVGALLDRFGARMMLGFGMFFWSVAQAACGMVNSLSTFLVSRAVLGVAEAPLFPAGAKVISEWYNLKERGTPTGIFVASSCIGPCIAPPLLTVIMLTVGWRWMFIITGILGVMLAIGWYLIYRNRNEVTLTQEDKQYLDAGERFTDTEKKITGREWRGLFTHATTWGMLLGFMGVIYMVWLYLTWLPGYLEHARGLSLARTGWVVAIPYIFGMVGMVVAGRVVDILANRGISVINSRKWPVCLGLLGGAAFTVPAIFTTSTTLAVGYICLAMFFINLASAACWTMATVIVPKRQVASLGSIQNCGGYFGGSLAPIITGAIVERTGVYDNALLVSAGIAVLAAAVYFVLVRKPLPDDSAASDIHHEANNYDVSR
ncbi:MULTISPECIES: MFS transporter [Enterobacteriaceae]|jgi:sugar phosphate permease|uniref:MFS transporter n=2 Tax=Atlantibacter subterraneus TaxID=255519 RepID=A0A3R9G0Z6_9ENTR|nr:MULTISPECIES: MFS transporter [Enterobacteriaceae]MDZ5664425.1 MFS transporter [Atlantibacter hermannii]MDA3133925.1 MFS transporter [Atlantibacter subterranea]MDV7021477.1 MFS transporter [Atlantibacter subterranea]RSB64516.1 MFS transporter [Atlantibacter subterranea]RSE07694.1 MFS transporter [Atlantibacter subterranea]